MLQSNSSSITQNTIFSLTETESSPYGIGTKTSSSNNIIKNNYIIVKSYPMYMTGTDNLITENNITTIADSTSSIGMVGTTGLNITYNNMTLNSTMVSVANPSYSTLIAYNNISAAGGSTLIITAGSNYNITQNRFQALSTTISHSTTYYENLSVTDNYINSTGGVAVFFGATNGFKNITLSRNTIAGTGALTLSTGITNSNISFNNMTATSTSTSSAIIAISGGNTTNEVYIQNNSMYRNTTQGYGVFFVTAGSNNMTISGNRINTTGTSTVRGVLAFGITDSYNITVKDNILASSAAGAATHIIYIASTNSLTNSYFLNNTLLAPSATTSMNGVCFRVTASGGTNNTFLGNNCTSNAWRYDENGSNFYNDTKSGNIYYNRTGTAAWQIYNLSSSTPSNWADQGTARPIYYNTTPLYVSISDTAYYANGDWFPWTGNTTAAGDTNYTQISAISVIPSSPNTTNNLSCNLTYKGTFASANISVEWYANGTNQTLLASSYTGLVNNTATLVGNITSGNLSAGANWSCRARAMNGTNISAWNMSANVTIASPAIILLNLTYPANGTNFGPGQCWLLAIANLTYPGGAVNKTASASLYIGGIYDRNITDTITANGIHNFNFTGLTQTANYSINVTASDSISVPVNASVWATVYGVSLCTSGVQNTTSNETRVYTYAGASVLGFNLNQILGLIFILISVWAGFRYMIMVKTN
jgi:hypothetical protein